MICQNQSIDESNAPLARDLRILIRNKIKEGNNNEEIYKFLTDRYGDFILLKPPIQLSTLALWFLPFIFLILGIFVILFHNKKSKKLTLALPTKEEINAHKSFIKTIKSALWDGHSY